MYGVISHGPVTMHFLFDVCVRVILSHNNTFIQSTAAGSLDTFAPPRIQLGAGLLQTLVRAFKDRATRSPCARGRMVAWITTSPAFTRGRRKTLKWSG